MGKIALNVKDVFKKNGELKNRHAGRRCFLIGNGPSIAEQDLLLLKDDIKICFNSFHKHHQCKEIAPDYWMTADPDIWKKKDQFLIPLLNAIENKGIATRLFFPHWGKIAINGSQYLNIHYFNYDDRNRDLREEIDFCEGIPPFAQNVMIVGLMLAFYLGCNPIILLGADHSWWAWKKETYKGKETPHFFKNDYSPISERYSFDVLQSTIHVQRHQYLQLSAYAAQRGFAIYNATPDGELDLFPRIDYAALFPNDTSSVLARDYLSDLAHISGHLGDAAKSLISDRQFAPALVLINEAMRQNINRQTSVSGLNYLRALCLAGLGHQHAAVQEARQDFLFNPGNREHSSQLLSVIDPSFET